MAMPPRPRPETSYRPSIFPNFSLTSDEEDEANVWAISLREAAMFIDGNRDITIEYILSLKLIKNAENDSVSARVVTSNAVIDQINEKKVLLLADDQHDADTRIHVDTSNISLQNAVSAIALTIQYYSVLHIMLRLCLPKSLGGGKLFEGDGSRIPRNLWDIHNKDGDYWLPPIRIGAFSKEVMDMNCIHNSIERKRNQDIIVIKIMQYYMASIRGVGLLAEILREKIAVSGMIDRNRDRYFISQIAHLQSIEKHSHRTQLKRAKKLCEALEMEYMQP